ncbi:olfactory receptor 8K5-like [Tenrec ecaudatus]|uniref:olfactory receptor 8K5-like n=1 Tax=Tenrec ecaudatus TaxID=94439 RepID=UPI003F593F2A
MGQQNLSILTEFILMRVTKRPELQLPLFGILLIIYMIILLGNLGMIILTKVDSRLHTPMYFFIRNLALIDLGNATVIYPKVLACLASNQYTISYYACAVQMAVYLCHIISVLFVLAAMAYDRFVAICKPLLYNVIMSQRLCHLLVGIPYIASVLQSVFVTSKIFTSTFCGSNVVTHFYCDDAAFIPLLCSNAREIELIIITFSGFKVISTFLFILMTYLLILIAIFRMHSAEGRKKAFSTCGSHLTVVVVFYGSVLYMYLQPESAHSSDNEKIASVFYTLFIPMLNPFIYSLRNKEVKNAFKRVFKNHCKICI